MKNIVNCVGGHDLAIYTNSAYDPAIRKYRGGELLCVIPYSGSMLSAKLADTDADPVRFGDAMIATKVSTVVDADPIPSDDDTFFVVSALYVAACKQLGRDTSHLLTIGGTVVGDDGKVIGTAWLNRN